jgi:hypothetical protein
MRRMTLSTLALLGALAATDVARAGCCDDFWSCLGAVATGGISCQVQGMIDTVNAMKTLVETVTNDLRTRTGDVIAQAQKAVGDATSDMKTIREQSLQGIQRAAERAPEIANPVKAITVAPGAVAVAGPKVPGVAAVAPAPGIARPAGGVAMASAPAAQRMADAAGVQDALKRADTYLQDVRAKSTNPQNDAANAERAAIEAAARHIRTAQQISLDVALAPLNLLRDSLLDLLTHPERLFDPSAQIEADIQRITAEVPRLFDRIANEVTQEAMANLDRGKAGLSQLQDAAAAGGSVVDAMTKVTNSQAQADLDALNRLLPAPAPSNNTAVRAIVLPIGISGNRQLISAAFLRTDPGKLPLVVQNRAAIGELASKWQTIKVRAKPQLEAASVQRVDRDLGQMFTGKAKGDVDKKKLELLEEAKKRFAKDPKTLEKVQQYIESHAKG